MRGRSIEVIVNFLYIFAMIAFETGKSEESLLEYRIFFIPQTERKTECLLPVTDAAYSIFSPAPGFAAGHIVGSEGPGTAIGAVIFPNCSPLPFAEIGSPFFPCKIFKPFFFYDHLV